MTTKTSRNRSTKTPKKKNSSTMNLVLIGTGAVVIFTILFVIGRLSQNAQVVSVDASSLVYEDSPTLGPADAPVTIVEFLDPECESCRAMYPVIKDVMKKYEGRVRLVVRYLPLHNSSVVAAAVTEAAGAQGKYWEMQELLFTKQPEWGERSTPPLALFAQYAQELGLDMVQFEADLKNPDYLTKIERDKADAAELGLRGTPSIFVNGQQVRQLGAEALTAAIESALR